MGRFVLADLVEEADMLFRHQPISFDTRALEGVPNVLEGKRKVSKWTISCGSSGKAF